MTGRFDADYSPLPMKEWQFYLDRLFASPDQAASIYGN